jgi:hypothetical protein
VVDAFDQVNHVFQRPSSIEVQGSLQMGRALFIAVAGKDEPHYGREPLVTNWVSCKADIACLRTSLSAMFDLETCIAISDPYPYGTALNAALSPIAYAASLPRLLESVVSPSCHRSVWADEMMSKYPDARLLWYKCGTKTCIRRALEQVCGVYASEKNGDYGVSCSRQLPDPGVQARLIVPKKSKPPVTARGWQQYVGGMPVQTYEHLTILRYFQETMHDFLLKMKYMRWGGYPPKVQPTGDIIHGDDVSMEIEDTSEDSLYAEEMYDAVLRDCYSRNQMIETSNGHRERVYVY